jgi:type IV secretory pathway ATPase VirB11/archaellum biosynthesis ATPase
MLFKQDAPLYSTEVERREGETVLYINYLGAPTVPSLADSPEAMARTIDFLEENPSVSRVVFVQQRNYHYSFEQVTLLADIARLYSYLTKQERILSPEKIALSGLGQQAYDYLTYLLILLKQDPLSCYMELRRLIRSFRLQVDSNGELLYSSFVRLLEHIQTLLEKTSLISAVLPLAETYTLGDRSFYKPLLRADILPNFTFTRLVAQLPPDAELISQYTLSIDEDPVVVTIVKRLHDTAYTYHIMPPEYTLSEDHHLLLNLGRTVLIEHQPKAEEFIDAERTRAVFFNVARDLLNELAQNRGIPLNYRELTRLATILVRQTIGFGLIEVLLMDSQLQDIYLNAPLAQNPVYVRHAVYGECVTNVIPSYEDAESWAAKLRLQSGRPLDEANPILDTDLYYGKVRARVAAIQRPLSPGGIAYAIRRPRDEPWTLPLFVQNKMLNSFSAGLLSFLIDGSRTLLIAGTRGSGKTSLLGSLLFEIMPKYRVLVIEDTLELPVDSMRKLGYNIQRMKVRSALIESTTEIEAAEGIRASLRLGDSALIVGEVRSTEARALYEAMRVGALANVVAGTIHGASPYGVFDRLVNDLNVPVTSFKATDLVIVANPIKTPDGLHSRKRVVQVSEVRKHWTKDPLEEKGFVDLLTYNVDTDELEPSEALINGESEVIKDVASQVKGWAGNWDAIYDNILLRGQIIQELVNTAHKHNKPKLLEAPFVLLSNNVFHLICDRVTKERGVPVSSEVLPAWKKWLYEQIQDSL